MPQRLTPESKVVRAEERAPLGERLLRNQRGILIALALTLAAAIVLILGMQR